MLKTCFGLCALRSGINVVAVFNMIIVAGILFLRLMFHFVIFIRQIDESDWDIMRSNNWNRKDLEPEADDENNSTATVPLVPWNEATHTSMWIYFIWMFLILITNVCLKQSTFKQAPHKIYAWLVINYATLLYLTIHMFKYIVLLRKYRPYQILIYANDPYVGDFICNFLMVVVLGVQIITVHSYYIEENKAVLNDVIQLKWRHVSNGVVLAQGVDYPAASAFQETVHRGQTDEQRSSRIPPYVTNILLDRY